MKDIYKGLLISAAAGMLLGMLAFEPQRVEDTPSNRRQTPHMI
jgi:hypothetical protein